MAILVTGGLGYIGSHTCIEMLESGEEVVIVDNLSNSTYEVLDRIQRITQQKVSFYEADVRNKDALIEIFQTHAIQAVVHFAGLKSVNESVSNPLHYYDNNIGSTLVLTDVMNTFQVKQLIFSSSATVYGNPATLPITEEFPLSTTNPYGASKRMIEDVLRDLSVSDNRWSIMILRYFNPIGAHESGLLGEKPNGVPNNLLPYVAQVATGEREQLHIFGNDYPTKDGTAVRDFIHVVDLAKGHVQALKKSGQDNGVHVYNLGTGTGYSVQDIVQIFQEVSGRPIPFVYEARRAGDVPACYADATKARVELGWIATKTIQEMCRDTWNWVNKE